MVDILIIVVSALIAVILSVAFLGARKARRHGVATRPPLTPSFAEADVSSRVKGCYIALKALWNPAHVPFGYQSLLA